MNKFDKYHVSGKCSVCGINCWKECSNKPGFWPCGVTGCPYPEKDDGTIAKREYSSTGNGLALLS